MFCTYIFYIYIHSKTSFRDKGSTSTFLFFLFPLPFFQKVCIPTILAVKTEEDTDWLAIKQDRILLQANRDYLAKIVILYIVLVIACGGKKESSQPLSNTFDSKTGYLKT